MKPLKILTSEERIIECRVEYFDGRPGVLHFYGPDSILQEYTCSDLFEGLRELRENLENLGLQVLCAGARPNVWPSPMGRDMADGVVAYVMQLGERPSLKDLVNIFDYAEPFEVGTLAEQKAFYGNWIRSIGLSQ